MAKITLRTASSGYQTTADLNQNFSDISSEFQNKVLYRVNPAGEPNQMENDLDMNSFKILNVKEGSSSSDAVNYKQLQNTIAGASSGLIVRLRERRKTATDQQQVFNFVDITYSPGSNNLQVYVNGIAQVVNIDYTETSSTSITFISGLQVGDVVDAYSNESVTSSVTDAQAVEYTANGSTQSVKSFLDSLSSTTGASLIGLLNGTVADAITYVTPQMFGAKGDGTTDDTAAIQSAIDSVKSSKGAGIVLLPKGDYKITSQIELKRGIRLEGIGVNDFSGSYINLSNTNASRILVEFGAGSSVFDSTNAAILQRESSQIAGIAFYYPNQVSTGTPTVYAPTIWIETDVASGYTTDFIVIENCLFQNPYTAIDCSPSNGGRIRIENIYGSPLFLGLRIDGITDYSKFSNINWQPGYISSDISSGSLREWIQNNCTGFQIGRTDATTFSYCTTWAIRLGIEITTPTSGSQGITFTRCVFDACSFACVYFNSTNMDVLKFNECSFTAFTDFNGSGSAPSNAIQSSPTISVNSISFLACSFYGPSTGSMYLHPTSTCKHLQIDGCYFLGDSVNSGTAISISGFNYIVATNNFITGFLTSGVDIYAHGINPGIISENIVGAGGISASAGTVIKNNQGYKTENSGTISATFDSSAVATFNHGLIAAPTFVSVSGIPSSADEVVVLEAINATQIKLRLKKQSSGANIVSSTRTVVWEAKYAI